MIFGTTSSVYKSAHALQNDLRLRILGNKEIFEKSQNCVKLDHSTQSLTKIKA